ncbi:MULTISPECIES: KpsF/GutQ family sugar-phosphate isomerase [Sulfurimonas]|uniref:KpsF/GutQ family sugar-phosphate isomerase n=1 Tax=Sulfurimonas TaxID=202746 RepID=UPI0012658A21|nr:KpsF/GutQ family sugar-phosphate isomerase [Sulfurimonas indica]
MNYKTIAQETLDIEASTLQEASKKIGNEFDKAVEMILNCKGKLVVSGVGKSGLIGAKMAATFASTGTPSFFLHPTEALHGDLGMIGSDDVVLAISYSGESEELSSILPHIKRFDVPLIGMTRNENSTLGTYSDLVIKVSVEREACPLNIAPTSSTTLTLALGDALAVCLMKARDFQKSDFASFHPGGALGKKLFVKVKNLMRTENLPLIGEDAKVKDAILTISEGRLGTALIVDKKGRLVALMSDGDVRRALLSENFSLDDSVLKYATKNPLSIDDEEMLASDALVLIEEKKIQLLVVTDTNKKIKGVLHIHTLIEKGIS